MLLQFVPVIGNFLLTEARNRVVSKGGVGIDGPLSDRHGVISLGIEFAIATELLFFQINLRGIIIMLLAVVAFLAEQASAFFIFGGTGELIGGVFLDPVLGVLELLLLPDFFFDLVHGVEELVALFLRKGQPELREFLLVVNSHVLRLREQKAVLLGGQVALELCVVDVYGPLHQINHH